MSDEDIVDLLRECAEDSRKSEGDYYADQYATAPEVFDEAANEIVRLRAEIARLRLADAEREAIKVAAGCMGMWMIENGIAGDGSLGRAATTMRGLLERLR